MPARLQRYAIETGERVFLRYPVKSDRDEFIALRRNSKARIAPWEPIPPSGFDPFSDEVFDREYKDRKNAHTHRWLICTLDTGEIAGRICLNAIERGPFQNGRFGYWLGDGFVGKGYMGEGITLALRHTFETLGLHRVSANIMPSNTRSTNTIRRCGFVKEGYSPRYLQIYGAWEDHERYAITAERWLEFQSED